MARRYRRTFGIKVSEIPDGIDEPKLRRMFSRFGNITSIHVKHSLPFNHAYINYDSLHDARKAAEHMDKKNVHGGTLKVKVQDGDFAGAMLPQTSKGFGCSRPDPFFGSIMHPVSSSHRDHSDSSIRSNADSDMSQFSVKISNINPNTTQVELNKLFKTAVILRRVPGNKSYAYANYKFQQEMESAMLNHNVMLDGLKIQVKMASSKYECLCDMHIPAQPYAYVYFLVVRSQ